ncbi:MAG: type 4a pilus biogenesis protein PilO [Rhodanobacteraceae bacterium]|nr:type 4a pilus biogenesis protein PilO [Rhodanobacteraceae bacterium]
MKASSGAAPSRSRWIIIVSALFAGTGLGSWLLSGTLDQVERGEAAVNWLDETIDLRRRQLSDRESYAQEVAAVRKDIAVLQQLLPGQFADAEVDSGLQVLAQRHGLVLDGMTRSGENLRDFYASRELRFALRGRTAALQAFFRDYADIVPVQRIRGLQLASVAGSDGEFSVAVQAEEYRYIENEARR